MSGIGQIVFDYLKYNHDNNHDNIVTIFFSLLRKLKKTHQKSLLRTKVITFLRKCACVLLGVTMEGLYFGTLMCCMRHSILHGNTDNAYMS